MSATSLVAAFSAIGAQAATTTIMSGLDNPRHLHVAGDGSIYVAEAGRGGPHCSGPRHDRTCIGFTSAVSRFDGASQDRVVTGLVSAAGKDGSFAVGADDVAVSTNGDLFSIETSAGKRPGLSRSYMRQLGRLLQTAPSRRSIARIDKYEFDHNPDHRKADSNPYTVAIDPAGGWVVADAAANDLLHVSAAGRVSVLAVFHARHERGVRKAVESVPTSVAVGPDGAFYVGELRGDAAPQNSARVWRVAPGEKPSVFASGFNRIVGIDFGPDGSLFVAELTTARSLSGGAAGAVIRQTADGTRTDLAPGELDAPGGVAVGGDGTVYVSVDSLSARRGRVVRIEGTEPSPAPSGSDSSGLPTP